MADADCVRRHNIFELCTAAYHFVHDLTPFRAESRAALEVFIHAIQTLRIGALDLQAILLQTLIAIDPHTSGRLPGLVDRYLSMGGDLADGVDRFYRCVDDVLKYRGSGSAVVQEAIAFIETHFEQSAVTAASVARHLGITSSELAKLFRCNTGVTCGSYLRDVRLDRAARRLLTTDIRRMKELCVGVGYNHRTNFNHDFRRRFGMSPRKYRARGIRKAAEHRYPVARGEGATVSQQAKAQLTVLIVDDDAACRETTGQWLRSAGYNVVLAGNGEEGLAAAKTWSPRVILLDLHLSSDGSATGVDILKRLRSMKPRMTPAIAVVTADPFADEFDDEIHRLDAILIWKLRPLEDIEILVASMVE